MPNPSGFVRPALHSLQRKHNSSGNLSFQSNFTLHSSWFIAFLGRSKGLSNPSESNTVATVTDDKTPFRLLGCSYLLTAKSMVSRSTFQWIPNALSVGKLCEFKSKFLTCGARSSTGNTDKTFLEFEFHFVSSKPPFASNSCNSLMTVMARSECANDLSKSSTKKCLNTASTASLEKSCLLSSAVFLRAYPATLGEDFASKICTSICYVFGSLDRSPGHHRQQSAPQSSGATYT